MTWTLRIARPSSDPERLAALCSTQLGLRKTQHRRCAYLTLALELVARARQIEFASPQLPQAILSERQELGLHPQHPSPYRLPGAAWFAGHALRPEFAWQQPRDPRLAHRLPCRQPQQLAPVT